MSDYVHIDADLIVAEIKAQQDRLLDGAAHMPPDLRELHLQAWPITEAVIRFICRASNEKRRMPPTLLALRDAVTNGVIIPDQDFRTAIAQLISEALSPLGQRGAVQGRVSSPEAAFTSGGRA